ncbi:hypothetical protein MTR67_018598 [Solanum verrucosum]|uniref:PUM-HD domain-containing protein n=1 Tax=Solanum verrucosum TaxID=315347 RepID=A0AAF0QLA1_SOLVR|nr:hypothetical protein MTR67_018598 [Solanum verrucosum]
MPLHLRTVGGATGRHSPTWFAPEAQIFSPAALTYAHYLWSADWSTCHRWPSGVGHFGELGRPRRTTRRPFGETDLTRRSDSVTHRSVQRLNDLFESAGGELRDCIITEILINAMQLSEDQYGNYVVQHLLGLKLPRVTYILIDRLQGNFLTLSCNKYASNVIEKIILDSREEHSTRTITELLSNPSGSMLLMDPYGNFVIQSSLQREKDFFFLCMLACGNTHNDILLAKLETVNTSSGEPGSSVFVFNMDRGSPVWSEWLVFNRVNARARKGLVLGPMRLLLSFSGGHVVGNFPPHEAFVLGGTNSFPCMNMWSDGENDQTSSSKS